jgi:hypothetical protein
MASKVAATLLGITRAARCCSDEARRLGRIVGELHLRALPGHSLDVVCCYAERGSVVRNGNLGIHWSLGLQSNAVEKKTIRQPLGRLPGEKQLADQLRIVLAEPVDKNDPKSVRKIGALLKSS